MDKLKDKITYDSYSKNFEEVEIENIEIGEVLKMIESKKEKE